MKPLVNHLSVRPALLGLALAIALVASSCASPSEDGGQSSASGSGAPAPPTAVVEPAVVEEALAGQATLIDVRTPEEFDAGHLSDASNIDLASPDFDQQIDELDREESYVVYCASGNRAGQAVEQMLAQGFTDVVNGGGYEELSLALPSQYR